MTKRFTLNDEYFINGNKYGVSIDIQTQNFEDCDIIFLVISIKVSGRVVIQLENIFMKITASQQLFFIEYFRGS